MPKREDLIKFWGLAWADYVNKSCLLTSAYRELIFYSWKYFIQFGNAAVPANALPIYRYIGSFGMSSYESYRKDFNEQLLYFMEQDLEIDHIMLLKTRRIFI